ncbi:MAG: protoheme IX farnesyltransferase [Planctomycetota bacterium]|nr:MAG: protoheme IX farnesyltransferase [Planctomycetota bacterium]
MPARLGDWIALTKARIQLVATLAALACMWLAGSAALEPLAALHLVIGLTLVSSAAAALNQVAEVEVDGRMERTRNRPLPAGRMEVATARRFGLAAGALGVLWLALFLNAETAWLAAVMLVLYVWVYTPLKRLTVLNTLVGGVPGAMPLLIGWAAAGHGLDLYAGILFAILYLWQFPHFLAIAWLYREDYERGGLKMLTGLDESGAASARQAAHYCLALVPVALLPTLLGFAGRLYFFAALSLTLGFLAFTLNFSLRRSRPRARLLLWSSLVYLPLLVAALVLDAALPRGG